MRQTNIPEHLYFMNLGQQGTQTLVGQRRRSWKIQVSLFIPRWGVPTKIGIKSTMLRLTTRIEIMLN